MFHDLIFLCIYFYTGHYYCKEYCLVLGTCISVHQEKESRDTTFKNGVAKTDSYFRKNLVLNTGKKKNWQKNITVFCTNRTQSSGLGPPFLTAFSEKCSHWIICLLACFSPQLFPQQLFTICRQQNLSKRFIPLARFKKGTAVRSCAWTFCVLIFLLWKVSLAKLYNLTTKNLQPQLLSPSNGYYWTLLLSKMNTDSKYFPFAFFSVNCKTAAT